MGLIQTAESIEQHVKDAYTALQASGASLPEQRNLANLAGCVETVPTGMGSDELISGEYGVLEYRDAAGGFRQLQISSQSGLSALASSIGSPSPATVVAVEGTAIQIGGITRFKFGPSATTIPDYFMNQAASLRVIEGTEGLSMTNGFGYFLQGCTSLDCPIVFPPSLTVISNSALAGCYLLNHEVVLPPNVREIGVSFMARCFSYQQTLRVPGSLTHLGNSLLANYASSYTEQFYLKSQTTSIFVEEGAAAPDEVSNYYYSLAASTDAPAYTNGITLTGPGAAAWKAALPNGTTSGRGRNLILG